jgi:glyceraldehyde 3-phosphate dehydrogenase
MKVAINGMGRIGRLLFRRLLDHPDIDIVAVNDIMDVSNLLYLLKYDSVYGSLNYPIEYNGSLLTNAKEIKVYSEADAADLPWKSLGIDVVLECSGKYTSHLLAGKHLQSGAKKVLLSTTGTEDIPLMIYGHNQHGLNSNSSIISPGGCMTNCSTHILYLLNSIGIESVQINILHSYTSRQQLVDHPNKDFRRGRAAAESIIPVPVDLAESLERLFPMLKSRIAAMTTRVPVANGAVGDFTIQLKQHADKETINQLFKKAAKADYKGIIEYTEDPIVSLDIKGNPHSAVIDGSLTSVIERQVKLIAFFDNEYGYTNRMIDWLLHWKQFI